MATKLEVLRNIGNERPKFETASTVTADLFEIRIIFLPNFGENVIKVIFALPFSEVQASRVVKVR
jgi:4-aminobutyrate aminotransferase-like enzyme